MFLKTLHPPTSSLNSIHSIRSCALSRFKCLYTFHLCQSRGMSISVWDNSSDPGIRLAQKENLVSGHKNRMWWISIGVKETSPPIFFIDLLLFVSHIDSRKVITCIARPIIILIFVMYGACAKHQTAAMHRSANERYRSRVSP